MPKQDTTLHYTGPSSPLPDRPASQEALLEELQDGLRLLKLEEEAEREYYRERIKAIPLDERIKEGTSLYPLIATDISYGYGEVPYLTLEPTDEGTDLSAFGQGQVCSIFRLEAGHDRAAEHAEGVVARLRNRRVVVALHSRQLPDWLWEGKLGLDQYYDDRTYREMERAINRTLAAEEGPGARQKLAHLRSVLLGTKKAAFGQLQELCTTTALNQSQRHAVNLALAAQDSFFIHGPPGTGKTTTLVECIRLISQTERYTLVCAPSNTAVDVLAERLDAAGLQVVRLGHPARVSDELQALTLDGRMESHTSYKQLRQLRRKADELRKKGAKFKRVYDRSAKHKRRQAFAEAKALSREAKELEEYILQDVLYNTQVFLSTLNSAGNALLGELPFKTLVIDEACQALEPSCWIAMQHAQRVILAGDPYQLPPTVRSRPAATQGLGISLAEKFFYRQQELKQPMSNHMLRIQYRMHEAIMGYSNKAFYGGLLEADASVAQRLLPIEENRMFEFIDTAGCGHEEERSPRTLSLSNHEEALLLLKRMQQIVQQLIVAGYHPSIGLLAPYADQVKVLRNYLEQNATLMAYPGSIQAKTIDGFQGQERGIMGISLVRTNNKGEIGFLKETRRLNVALTRAQRKLIVVGDSATLASHPFYAGMVAYVEALGGHSSAWAFMDAE